MSSNKGGGLVAMYAVKTSDQQRPRRRPISDRTRQRMIALLAKRGKWANQGYSDQSLVFAVRGSRP
jgi:hypothetical protein